jgi:YHS domain-containing protein
MSGIRAIAISFALIMFGCASTAGVAHADDPINTNGTRFAIGGYDPVAFFTDRRPVRGREEFSAQWSGATWLFASDAHRATFVASPQRYAPKYGGYCAYAVSQGRFQRIDPNAWTVVAGKLYLNYSIEIRNRWSEDRDDYIEDANEKWPALARTRR